MRIAAYGLLGAVLVAGPARADEKKTYEVEVVKNRSYVEGDKAHKTRHRYDLYLPKGAKDYPVFFFIHGGAWRGGSKDGFGKHGRTFAKHGIAFVATNYRLSPSAKHPAHIEDVAAAFAKARADLAKRGANVKRVFVGGHSAGGHLAALLATDPDHLKKHKLALADVKGVVPISGVFVLGSRQEEFFGDEESRKKASPQTHASGKLPPFLVLYAQKEIAGLGRQAEAFGKAVKKHKGDITVRLIKDRDHGSIMMRAADKGDDVTRLIFSFIEGDGRLKQGEGGPEKKDD
jgi:acetyl esterase/lipase